MPPLGHPAPAQQADQVRLAVVPAQVIQVSGPVAGHPRHASQCARMARSSSSGVSPVSTSPALETAHPARCADPWYGSQSEPAGYRGSPMLPASERALRLISGPPWSTASAAIWRASGKYRTESAEVA